MPVKIRLQRFGRKHHAYFRIVVADARSPRDGRFIERIGSYDPHKEFDKYDLNHEAALRWLRNGAQPTETVRTILSEHGVMLRHHLIREGKTEEEAATAYEAWLNKKTSKTEATKQAAGKTKEQKAAEAMARETKVREDRAAKISSQLAEKAKEAAAAAAAIEAEAKGTATEEADAEHEAARDAKAPAEAPVAEAPAEETPAAAEPAAEEAPAAEENTEAAS